MVTYRAIQHKTYLNCIEMTKNIVYLCKSKTCMITCDTDIKCEENHLSFFEDIV